MKYLISTFVLLLSIHASGQYTPATEAKIDSLINLLTLEEKVAMCHAQSKFSTPGVDRLGIPELWMSDGPHGVRPEISWDSWAHAGWTNDFSTAFPALTCLAATFNPELSYKYGFALGQEARYREKDILLGPGVNIYRTPLNGRNFEYMGEDPLLASKLVVPYIKGVQENGVAACVKHYVLNNQEKWRSHINVEISDRALYEIYLPAFKAAVIEGEVWSIMGAYNQYRGQFCSHNERLNNTILKGEWGFDGVVITDWGAAHDTRQSAMYGLDLEMGTGTDGLTTSAENAYDYYYLAKPFLELLRAGEIPEEVVNDKVRRILRTMYRTNMNTSKGFGKMNSNTHSEIAREVATEGIVLLKNESSLLPLDVNTTKTIAVIGENATRSMTIGGGSSELKAKYEISPLVGIQKAFSSATILHSMGYASGPSLYGETIPTVLDADSLYKAAIETAKKADFIVFIGGLNKSYQQDCEGADRLVYGLPYGQDELIKELAGLNKNFSLVLVSGNAIEMPWIDEVPTILQAWYLGSEAGFAIADIITGKVNPSGKLPFTFPVALEDNAAHHFGELSYPGDSINQYYKEDILVGYRWHDTKEIEPLFAFGHGLSYTQFELTKIGADQKKYALNDIIFLSCEVKNSGKVAGATVVQVYVGKEKSKVERAKKELKGFKKIYLEPGESQTIEIPISINNLAFYNETISGWEVEEGAYTIYVGEASDKITREIAISVK
ncbi:MAG TPA: glycosyl hydrolase [Bacteroidales bacterium]|nr:glycosyl hydrolase [Bacteroidales bacterium]